MAKETDSTAHVHYFRKENLIIQAYTWKALLNISA